MFQTGVATEVELIVTACKLVGLTNREESLRLSARTSCSTAEISLLSKLQTGWSSMAHGNELPTTCSHDQFLRSCSSYHASRMRTSSEQPVLPKACSSASVPQEETTEERDGTCSKLQEKEADSSREPMVSAGRRSPNPTSSATCKLDNEEATSEMTAKRKLSSISTRNSDGETLDHIQSMPVQISGSSREIASSTEGGMCQFSDNPTFAREKISHRAFSRGNACRDSAEHRSGETRSA